jgi:hypothetical protein
LCLVYYIYPMKKQQSVSLCGETPTEPRHIFAFFDSLSSRAVADALSSYGHVILKGKIQSFELLKTLMRRTKRPLTCNN